MTWTIAAFWGMWIASGVAVWLRGRAEFQRGYLLALDHVAEMARPGWTFEHHTAAVAKLRAEMRNGA